MPDDVGLMPSRCLLKHHGAKSRHQASLREFEIHQLRRGCPRTGSNLKFPCNLSKQCQNSTINRTSTPHFYWQLNISDPQFFWACFGSCRTEEKFLAR